MTRYTYALSESMDSVGLSDIGQMMREHIELSLVLYRLRDMVNHRNDMRADASALIDQTLAQYFSQDTTTGGKK